MDNDEPLDGVEPWPPVPLLATLPPVARLAPRFDDERLRADVQRLQGSRWKDIRIVSGAGVGAYATKLDWRAIPLRSIGGDGERGDPGGPGLLEFADTPWLSQVPYLAQVLAAIPATLRSVRLMALGPGARSPRHSDTKCGLPWGTLRLHMPIVTVPEATLTMADESYCWESGTLWYADFTRGHIVENVGTRTRVHLVIDAFVTPELLQLFPAVFGTGEVREGSLFNTVPVPLAADQVDALRCRFALPTSFRSWEEPDGEFLRDQPTLAAAVDWHGDGLALCLDGEPIFGLIHLGAGEFRFAGWTAERTVQICLDGDKVAEVILRTRIGSQVRARSLAADAISPMPCAIRAE